MVIAARQLEVETWNFFLLPQQHGSQFNDVPWIKMLYNLNSLAYIFILMQNKSNEFPFKYRPKKI